MNRPWKVDPKAWHINRMDSDNSWTSLNHSYDDYIPFYEIHLKCSHLERTYRLPSSDSNYATAYASFLTALWPCRRKLQSQVNDRLRSPKSQVMELENRQKQLKEHIYALWIRDNIWWLGRYHCLYPFLSLCSCSFSTDQASYSNGRLWSTYTLYNEEGILIEI